MYKTGRGVTQDDIEAMRWFTLAAQQGVAHSQADLGLILINYAVGPVSEAAATKW
jgi:TPR repeat protein